MSALTSLLARDAVVPLSTIEDALQRQVLEGGELDTALLELDALDENVVGSYRAASYGLPPVSRAELMWVDKDTLGRVPVQLAEEHRVVPLTERDRVLTLAAKQPLAASQLVALQQELDTAVDVRIATEVRLEAALALHYGTGIAGRLRLLAERLEAREPGELRQITPLDGDAQAARGVQLDLDADDETTSARAPAPEPAPRREPAPSSEASPGGFRAESTARLELPVPSGPSGSARRPAGLVEVAPVVSLGPPVAASARTATRPQEPRTASHALPPPPAAPAAPSRPSSVPPRGALGADAPPSRVSIQAVLGTVARPREPFPGVPMGPLTPEHARELFELAEVRDHVVEVFFAFARQYFDASALFSVREGHVTGIEGVGLRGVERVEQVSVELVAHSALEEALRGLLPRVVDLGRRREDRPLAEALGRLGDQPAALMPVPIRQRAVLFLYGDRHGRRFGIDELAPLIAMLPVVGGAFERIIHERKRYARDVKESFRPKAAAMPAGVSVAPAPAQPDSDPSPSSTQSGLQPPRLPAMPGLSDPSSRSSGGGSGSSSGSPADPSPGSPGPGTSGGSPPKASSGGGSPPKASSGGGSPPKASSGGGSSASSGGGSPPKASSGGGSPPKASSGGGSSASSGGGSPAALQPAGHTSPMARHAMSLLGLRGDAPPPPARQPAALEDVEARQTVRLESVKPGTLPRPIPAVAPSPSAGAYHHSEPPAPRRRRSDTTRPERPSTRSLAPGMMPPSDTIPSPGSPDPQASRDRPVPRTLSQPPAGSGSYSVREVPSELAGATSLRAPRIPAEALEAAPPAPASTRGAAAPAREDTPSERPRKTPSRRPDPRRDELEAGPDVEVVSRSAVVRSSLPPAPTRHSPPGSIVIDLAPDAHALIDELSTTGPEDDQPQIAPLLRLGDVGLTALEARFPGPLWFSRAQLHVRFPAGRDVSPLARALIACDERGVGVLQRLLRSSDSEVRLAATLVAADWVHADLLAPFCERLFDEDGQIRRVASSALPVYQNVRGFDAMLDAMRRRAADEREAIANRLGALDAIAVLRDAGATEILIELQHNRERQISVPAHRALVSITAQDFGGARRKWNSWFDKNRARHRVEWLIDGLMHPDERVRAVAGGELQKLTQVYYGYAASAPKRARERSQERYRDWWDAEGRRLFG